MSTRGHVLLALFLVSSSAGTLRTEDLPIEVLRVARAVQTNRDLLKHLPLYTCLESVARSEPKGKGGKLQRRDTVQVDVGVGAREEMYSWPGDRAFSSEDLSTLVGYGLLSTGLFQSFANSLFVLQHGNVRFAGEESIEGRPAFHFTYTVPSLETNWKVNWNNRYGMLGEKGEFWVDKDDFTLFRLLVAADSIPANLPLKALDVEIAYEAVVLNGTQTLLPQTAELTAVEVGGKTFHNSAAFSHCHVFETESKMSSGEVDLQESLTRYEMHRGALPPGVTLQLRLQTAILAASAKVGDEITARLEGFSKLPEGVVLERGATLRGHVREFAKVDDPPDTIVVGLEFDELQWAGHSYSFLAEMVKMQQMSGVNEASFDERTHSANVRSWTGVEYKTTTDWVNPIGIPGLATFYLSDGKEIPKGFEMTWRTRSMGRR